MYGFRSAEPVLLRGSHSRATCSADRLHDLTVTQQDNSEDGEIYCVLNLVPSGSPFYSN